MDTQTAAIRPARPDDFRPAEALLGAAGLPLEGFRDHLTDALVALRGEELVGVVELELFGTDALLRSLVVASPERGRRTGERLAAEALALARRRGVRDVYLLTETASGFFPRFGFAVRERSAAPPALQSSVEFRSACPESATLMHARIDAA